MILSTYNINGINGRIEILLKWLRERSPDVVCLQEIKCQDKDFRTKSCWMQDTTLYGRGRKAGQQWRSFPKQKSKRQSAVCPVMLKMIIADISRLLSMA